MKNEDVTPGIIPLRIKSQTLTMCPLNSEQNRQKEPPVEDIGKDVTSLEVFLHDAAMLKSFIQSPCHVWKISFCYRYLLPLVLTVFPPSLL